MSSLENELDPLTNDSFKPFSLAIKIFLFSIAFLADNPLLDSDEGKLNEFLVCNFLAHIEVGHEIHDET